MRPDVTLVRPIAMLALVALTACSTTTPIDADLAIVGVSVIETDQGRVLPDRTVLIRDGRIEAIEPVGTVRFEALNTIDATGSYVMPGLIDMHVHTDPAGLAAWPLNGVTTVRDMGTQVYPLTADQGLLAARAEIARGERFGPEVFTPALILDGPIDWNPRWTPHFRGLDTPRQARDIVDALAAAEVDFIKVYSALTPELFNAVTERAARHGLSIAGHVPEAVGVGAAAEAGQRTVEHLRGILTDISSEEDAIRAELVAASADRDGSAAYRRIAQLSDRQLETRDADKADALFSKLAAHDVAVTPTLVVLWDPRWVDPDVMPDPDRLAELSPIYRGVATPRGPLVDPKWPFESVEAALRRFDAYQETVLALQRAGVDILVGTDAVNPFVFPGYSFHTELAMLVDAGLTPAEVLRSATLLGARHLGADERLGQIKIGYEADLVIIADNPLDDITHAASIEWVVMNGTHYRPEDLEQRFRGAVPD